MIIDAIFLILGFTVIFKKVIPISKKRKVVGTWVTVLGTLYITTGAVGLLNTFITLQTLDSGLVTDPTPLALLTGALQILAIILTIGVVIFVKNNAPESMPEEEHFAVKEHKNNKVTLGILVALIVIAILIYLYSGNLFFK